MGPGADPTKLSFFRFSDFPIFAVKLECLKEREKYEFMKNGQAYQRKTEIFFVSEEKKFGKIDSRLIMQKFDGTVHPCFTCFTK